MSGLAPLLRQRVQRDGKQLLIWTLGTGLFAYASYSAVSQSYGDLQERQALLVTVMANPVILLFRGLPSGAGEGQLMVFLILPWLAMLAAFMSTFLAVRHTRMDEEQARAELVAATPAGRTTPVVATVIHGLIANVVLAALTTLGFLATGLEPTEANVAGAKVAGFAVGAVGVAFLGIGLIAGQIMRTSRGANALAVWTLIVTFVFAGLGNALGTPSDDLQRMESSWLTWLSPFGWGENTRAYADDDLWPGVLALGFGLALAGVAIALQSARDLGEGFMPERAARAAAGPLLSTPTGLVWRLTWGAILGWTIGGLLTGMLSTALASVVDEVSGDNPAIVDILEKIGGSNGSLDQATVSVFFLMLGIFAAGAGVQTVIRARQEEAHGTAEPVLSAAVGRVRWLVDYLVVAVIAMVLVVAAGMLGALLGLGSMDDGAQLVETIVVTGLGQLAAASVFLVLTALVFVLAPRATIVVGWTLVVVGAIFGLFGPLFGFPDWMAGLSPLEAAPNVTVDGVQLDGLWWLLVVAAVGGIGSIALMRRRELATGG
ncbi:ABC transporter permease [Microbacterium terricola]|uniref:Exporter of polyketide antibiotics n=1 Tax=Microbacterium terricola TaxID=344163 RepID=A0ABM8E299_9MICO|nr:polyketide antibiotic transporter [Microbacterium terricola]UYK40207.1 polyketide antibiotic transporter [Microbacterium terricola]BDV32087.1 exporter of polyketide antibiotics [Microbacterium terricola]